jgi:Holliday junction DNA helicase RuvB
MTMSDHSPEHALRPRSIDDFIGQRELVATAKIAVVAARRSGLTLDHALLAGASGCGKTSLAHIIANELGARIHVTSGPAIEHVGALGSLLASLDESDILFIDEIHTLGRHVQESLYTALEDFRFDMFVGGRSGRKAITIDLPRFTLMGATTRPGLVTAPLRDRFGHQWHVRNYDIAEMTAIVRRSAHQLGIAIDDGGATELARRSRGTPRVANRLLRRTRDFTESIGVCVIDRIVAMSALDQIGVDPAGLDALDRRYLGAICETFFGCPVGIEAIAASLGEERETLEGVVEPFLLTCAFVARTPRGRVATPAGVAHWRSSAGPTLHDQELRSPAPQEFVESTARIQ